MSAAGEPPGQGAVTVRIAEVDDAASVGALTEHAYRVDGYLESAGGERYAGELLDAATRIAGAVVLVAEIGGEVVGTVTLAGFGTPFAEISRPGELEVRMLAVAPGARRRGLGAELMAATRGHARAQGLSRIVLSTEVSRHAVHSLYEGLGYARLPERDWSVEGFSLIAYGLDLD